MIIISISISIIITYTPLAMGLWILLLALLVSITTSSVLFSWFGFIVFLIYIGGILVIFAYFIAIQPNHQLRLASPSRAALITFLAIAITQPNQSIIFSFSSQPWVTTLFNLYNIPIILILALVLFLALLIVVKVSSFFMGPLRPFIYVQTYSKISPSH